MGVRAVVVLLCSFVFGVGVSSAQAAGTLGSLTQLPGLAGCVSADGSGGACATGHAIDEPESMAITHDGKFAYGSSYAQSPNKEPLTAYRIGPGGQLQQLAGKTGCYSEGGSADGVAGTCTAASTVGTGDGTSIAISPDDRFLYGISQGDSGPDGVAVFKRNKGTGALTQLAGAQGCVNPADAVSGACASGRALTGVSSVVMSPDAQGRFLYVTTYSGSHHGLAIFRRNPSTGVLTQLSGTAGCWTSDGLSEQAGNPCRDIRGIDSDYSPEDPVISADGKSLYFSAYASGGSGNSAYSAVIAFSRNPATGTVSQLAGTKGCLTSTGTALDGATCAKVRGLNGAYEEAISPEGKTLYVGGWDDEALVVLKRQSDGSLVQLAGKPGCISADGSSETGANTCQVGRAIGNLQTPAVSPDGRNVYTSTYGTVGGVSVFSRDPSTGALTQMPGKAGCFTTDGSSQLGASTCLVGRGLSKTYDVTVSPSGGNVYAAGYGGGFAAFSRQATPVCASQTVSLRQATSVRLSLSCLDPNGDSFHRSILTHPAHGKLGKISPSGRVVYTPKASFHGTDHIVFRASDASGPGVSAVITLVVKRDKTKPRCSGVSASKGRVGKFLSGGLPVHLKCSEAAKVSLALSAAKLGKLASGSGSLKAAGKLKVRLRFTKQAKHALGNANPKKLHVTLKIVAVDRAGNKSTKRVHLTLK